MKGDVLDLQEVLVVLDVLGLVLEVHDIHTEIDTDQVEVDLDLWKREKEEIQRM